MLTVSPLVLQTFNSFLQLVHERLLGPSIKTQRLAPVLQTDHDPYFPWELSRWGPESHWISYHQRPPSLNSLCIIFSHLYKNIKSSRLWASSFLVGFMWIIFRLPPDSHRGGFKRCGPSRSPLWIILLINNFIVHKLLLWRKYIRGK